MKSGKHLLEQDLTQLLSYGRLNHSPDPVPSPGVQPQALVLRSFFLVGAFFSNSVAAVGHQHAPRPLAGAVDTDVLGLLGGIFPARVGASESEVRTYGIVKTQFHRVAILPYELAFDRTEAVSHEGADPFGQRGALLQQGSNDAVELAPCDAVLVGDVQTEQLEVELLAEGTGVRRETFVGLGRERRVRERRRQGKGSCSGDGVAVGVELTHGSDLF